MSNLASAQIFKAIRFTQTKILDLEPHPQDSP